MRELRILLTLSFIVSMVLLGYAETTCAGGSYYKNNSNGFVRSSVPHARKHFVRISPRPPGWPQMWMARQIIKSLNENELIDKNRSHKSGNKVSDLPAEAAEVIPFSFSLNERILRGCVLEFSTKNDFEIIHGYYLDLNSEHKLHTWSIAKDNILVVIEGAMPEKVVQDYRYVLKGIDHR